MKLYAFVVGQGYILAVMFCLGIGLGILYDLIRVVRRLLCVGRITVNISDAIYWIVATSVIWYVQNETAEGVIRFCQLFAVALGMILYYIILSPYVIWIFYTPLHFMGKFFVAMYRYIGRGADAVLHFVGSRVRKKKEKDSL